MLDGERNILRLASEYFWLLTLPSALPAKIEPTNDLDVGTLNVLEEFLIDDFKGCLVVVSHDRWFMDRVAQHLFVFEGDGIVKDFLGTFSDYLDHLRAMESSGGASAKSSKVKADDVAVAQVHTQNLSVAAPAAKEAPRKKAKLSYTLQREYDGLEAEIESLSSQQEELQKRLDEAHSSGVDYATQADWAKDLTQIMESIDAKTERWMELEEMMEQG
jgi:ATP-binding cassette subfamily F protein uup